MQESNYHLGLNQLFYTIDTQVEYAQELLYTIISDFSETNLILSVWNEQDLSTINDALEFINSKNFKSIKLCCDPWNKNHLTTLNKFDITFVNFMALFAARDQQSDDKHINEVNPAWDPTLAKGLLLTGRLDRLHRIGLLKRLYDANLLDTVTWTFPQADKQTASIQQYYAESAPDNLDEFLEYCCRHALQDNKNIFDLGEGVTQFLSLGSQAPEYAYHNSNFSIISETVFESTGVCLTEKTFRTILNKHPFIMVGPVNNLSELKSLGFKTFNEYLPYPDYDSISDHQLRLDAIVANIAEFPRILIAHRDSIANDIQHNFNVLGKVVDESYKLLTDLYTAHNLPVKEIPVNFQIDDPYAVTSTDNFRAFMKKISIQHQRKYWITSYNNIKARHWPAVTTKKEFDNLPGIVQNECVALIGEFPN